MDKSALLDHAIDHKIVDYSPILKAMEMLTIFMSAIGNNPIYLVLNGFGPLAIRTP